MHDIVEWFFKERGMHAAEEKERFLNPDYERDIHDPFLMRGIDTAVSRVLHAVHKNERIAVYADFDADGIPGAVVLHDFFKKIGYENFEVYIPHRDNEGFGFHVAAVDTLAQRGVKLIITVDVGISGFEAAARARTHSIDVIITDHHVPNETLPDAYAILNPKQEGCAYPFKELCGAGVAFKLVCALLAQLRTSQGDSLLCAVPNKGWEKWLLDVVGIATIADMVPLLGENRVLARFGLHVLHKTRRPGLVALMRATRIRQHMATEDDVGFFIAPRINAASRMDSPDVAFRLLATTDSVEAETLAKQLEQLNRKRKTVVAQITKSAQGRASDSADIIVLGNPDWKPAFLGLSAQSLMQTYGKTVCLWGREANGTYKGSCRSAGDVALPELFAQLGDTLAQYGGHRAAGGFSFDAAQVHTLRESFVHAYRVLPKGATEPVPQVRAYDLGLAEFGAPLLRHLDQYAPFGVGNEKPMFVLRATVASVRRFGKGDAHLECTLGDSGIALRAIAFFYEAPMPAEGAPCTVYGTCERDTYRGGVVLRISSFG